MNEKHQENKKKLNKIGIVLLILGAIFAITGFVSFFSSFGTGEPPTLFWCSFIGLPLLGFGGVLMLTAKHQEISKYMKNESVPVMKEMYSDLKPEINDLKNIIKNNFVYCPSCNTQNDEGDRFCKKCGKELYRVCPHCNAKIDSDAAFCSKCGKEIDKVE